MSYNFKEQAGGIYFLFLSFILNPPPVCDIMEMKMKRFTILLILTVLLSGCAKEKPVYHEVVQNGIDVINAIEQGLPAECKTGSNEILFNVARKQMKNCESACDLAVAKVETEKLKWKWSVFGLLLVIGVYIARKVLK